jgi:hypothetical protein
MSNKIENEIMLCLDSQYKLQLKYSDVTWLDRRTVFLFFCHFVPRTCRNSVNYERPLCIDVDT